MSVSISFIEITKVLTKLSKEKDMECIYEWIGTCKNHLYWAATTTADEDDRVIVAKFKAFFDHIVNQHENLPDPLFNKCNHGPSIRNRKWLIKGD